MAQPSSSHREHGDRERTHRTERSHHRHHRTISSTTLLLVLSLVLAVLAVVLSLPSQTTAKAEDAATPSSILNYLTPKRSQALIAREAEVARREAEVARREAELLVGAPGGVVPTPLTCAPCPAPTEVIVKEDALSTPNWWKEAEVRANDILDRELKMADREREISKREESVNRREHDASRRESWIMEQLIAMGNEAPQVVEEEYVYDPSGAKRRVKALPVHPEIVEHVTHTVSETVFVSPPAATRRAAPPSPNVASPSTSSSAPKTTAIETIIEDSYDSSGPRVVKPTPRRPPSGWFGGWN